MDFDWVQRNPGIVLGGCCVAPEDRQCDECRTKFRSDGVAGVPQDEVPPWMVDERGHT